MRPGKKDIANEGNTDTVKLEMVQIGRHNIGYKIRKLREELTEAADDNKRTLATLEPNMKEQQTVYRRKAGRYGRRDITAGEIDRLSTPPGGKVRGLGLYTYTSK